MFVHADHLRAELLALSGRVVGCCVRHLAYVAAL